MADQNYVIDEPFSAKQTYGIAGDAICKRLINFGTGKSKLLPQHVQGLQEIKDRIGTAGDTIYIVGHASKQGAATGYDNAGLSRRRAQEVYEWFKYRMDVTRNAIVPVGEGDTKTIGVGNNDPKDQAVVIIAQDATHKIPGVLPPILPTPPHEEPDQPLKPDVGLFRRSGWEIANVSGANVRVETPIKGLSVGAGVVNLSLRNQRTKKIARYHIPGLAAEFDINLGKSEGGKGPIQPDAGLINKLNALRKTFPVNVGPADMPNIGSELIVSKWVPEPILADEFATFALISSFSGSVGLEGSGSWIMFTKFPFVPIVSELTVVALGVFAGLAFETSFGFAAENFNGRAALVARP